MLDDGFAVPRWYSAEHQRPNGEISYDLVMEDDMGFVEGAYRIGGCDWQILVISKRPVDKLFWKPCTWDNGVSGIIVHFPERMRLNTASTEEIMSDILGVGIWSRVKGPDSMQLR